MQKRTNKGIVLYIPFVLVGLLCAQESGGPPLGSPSDRHGNLEGRLHSGKNGDLLRIHTRLDRTHPPVCQTGLSSRRLRLPLDTDPTQKRGK